MAQKKAKPKGLKISQLARLAGVSIPTIKHYLKEGLLPRPIKTGRTMSYYDNECVERVRLIKRLQAERFLPLNVIKKIIRTGSSTGDELALGEALMAFSALSTPTTVLKRNQVTKQTGYSLTKIDKMEKFGLIHPQRTSRGKEYDSVDCQIISLVRQREQAGLPFEYSLEMMLIYRKHIQQIVREDAALFVREMLMNSSASDAARYIREGDRALGAFMPLIKAKLVRANAEKVIEDLNVVPAGLNEALRFRNLPEFREKGFEVAESLDLASALWLTLACALRRNKRVAAEPGIRFPDLANLGCGLGDLVSGRPERALGHLNKAMASKRLNSLAAALTGLAQIGKIPRMPGVLSPMYGITEAISSFDRSHQAVSGSDIRILVAYFRGVGLAIIPGIFDTHGKAAADLTKVIKSRDLDQPKLRGKKGIRAGIIEEMKLKASYFLAKMRLNDEQPEAATEILISMREKGGGNFYKKWARRQLKALHHSVCSTSNGRNACGEREGDVTMKAEIPGGARAVRMDVAGDLLGNSP